MKTFAQLNNIDRVYDSKKVRAIAAQLRGLRGKLSTTTWKEYRVACNVPENKQKLTESEAFLLIARSLLLSQNKRCFSMEQQIEAVNQLLRSGVNLQSFNSRWGMEVISNPLNIKQFDRFLGRGSQDSSVDYFNASRSRSLLA